MQLAHYQCTGVQVVAGTCVVSNRLVKELRGKVEAQAHTAAADEVANRRTTSSSKGGAPSTSAPPAGKLPLIGY